MGSTFSCQMTPRAVMKTRTNRPYAQRMAPQERRRQVLNAAIAQISEQGYAMVTIQAIATRVGVTRPVVYSVFANVDELLLTLLDYLQVRTLADVVKAVHTGGEGPDAVIRNSMDEFLRSIEASPADWRVLLQTDDSAAPDEVRRRCRRGRANVTAMLAETLTASLTEVPADFDAEMLAEAVVTLAHRCGTLMLENPERYPLERMRAMVEGLAISVSDLAATGG